MFLVSQEDTDKSASLRLLHPDRVLAAYLRTAFDGDAPTLVAVGGPGGTGKSTFARRLATALGQDNAVILTLDDYKTARSVRACKNLFGPHPEANEMQMICDHLSALREGRTIEKPLYCSQRGQISRFTPFSPARFVVVEGEISTYDAFEPFLDFSIFIDSHWKTQLNTRITRDIEHRGYTPEKAIATFLHSNLREFATYGAITKDRCDVHIHCGDDYTLVIDAVAPRHAPLIQTLSART